MQVDHYHIQQFLALSDLYFRLTHISGVDITHAKVEESLEAINDCEFSILPPEQRVV